MAFISNFRRSVMSDTRQSKGKGGKGGGWWEEFRLPQDPRPSAPFLIMDAQYIDHEAKGTEIDPQTGQLLPVTNFYYKGRRHRSKGFAGGKETFSEAVCSKGHDPFNPQPCAGCMAMESGNKAISLQDFFSFSIYHLSYYHGHPLVQKDGSLRTKDNGEAIVGYDECTGRDCGYCKILQGKPAPQGFPQFDPKSISTTFGRRRFLKMGKGHLSNLSGWDNAVSSLCGSCKATMQTEGFSCPTCDTILLDMEKDQRTTDQIAAAVAQPMHCSTCNRAVFVKEATFCPVCESAQRPWVENKLTDVVLFGSRQGEGTNSTLMLKQFLSIEEFQSQIKGLTDFLGKPLRQHIAENSTPYDFTELMKALPLDEQAKKLGIQVGAPAGSGHVPYGGAGPQSLPRTNYGK